MPQSPFQLKHFVLITFSFEGAAVALHAQEEGIETIVGVIFDQKDTETSIERDHATPEDPDKKRERLTVYGGLLDKRPVQEILKLLQEIPEEEKNEWFVFCDFNHCFKWAEKIAPLGIPGNYPTEEDRIFEIDRNSMKQFVDKHYKLDHQEVVEFKSVDDAKRFLEEESNVWVLKGKGDKVSTKVPDTNDPELAKLQIIAELDDNKKDLEAEGFILEEMITDAVEVTPEKLYYNGEPIFTDMDIEIKGLANDSGPMTGCTGDLVFPTSMKAKINKLAFPPIVDMMAKKHKGIFLWDLSMYFDTKTGKVYPGEFCPNRFGYSAFYNEIAQVGSVKMFFEAVVNGRNPFKEAEAPYGASVRIFNVPKQHDGEWSLKSATLLSSDSVTTQMWPMYVRKFGTTMVSTRYEWDLAVVTGQGETPREAVEDAYKNAEEVVFPDLYQLPIESFLSKRYAESVLNRFEYLEENKVALNLIIKTVAHEKQLYNTVGNYGGTKTKRWIEVSDLGNPTYELAIALHELIEQHLVDLNGTRVKDIDKFDLLFEQEYNAGLHTDFEEPGDDPRAPYFWEHQFASNLERQFILACGLRWDEYEDLVTKVWRNKLS